MNTAKPRVGSKIEPLQLTNTRDGSTVVIGEPGDRWTMLFVYRGQHCPRCKRFLNKLNDKLTNWTKLMEVYVVSADPHDRAQADQAQFGWQFELCHGLTTSQMRALGLYISDPLEKTETTWQFAEPGAFAIRPDGTLMLVDLSNGPAARPDLDELFDGMRFNITNDRPVRGTA